MVVMRVTTWMNGMDVCASFSGSGISSRFTPPSTSRMANTIPASTGIVETARNASPQAVTAVPMIGSLPSI